MTEDKNTNEFSKNDIVETVKECIGEGYKATEQEVRIKEAERNKLTKPNPDIVPRLIPLDYCTLERAAKMLSIEIDDIKHFNEEGYIALYSRFEESTTIANVWNAELEEYYTSDFYDYRFVPYHVAEIDRPKYPYCTEDIYIKYDGLEKLHHAIYGNILLSKLSRVESSKEIKVSKTRIDSAPCNFIAALMELLPDLKAKINETPTNAPEIFDRYLKSKGFNPLNLGNNNYKNWMTKSTYIAK